MKWRRRPRVMEQSSTQRDAENAAPVWTFSALVVRYGVEIQGAEGAPRTLQRGCFAHSLASWWVPLMADHNARYWSRGVACDYIDMDAGLVVMFVTDDPLLINDRFDGYPMEFSVGFGYTDLGYTDHYADLYEITVVAPPGQGACPGTRVLDMPRPATADEFERVRWAERTPNGAPVDDADRAAGIGPEVRARYGVRRDDFDPLEFWTDLAGERRRKV